MSPMAPPRIGWLYLALEPSEHGWVVTMVSDRPQAAWHRVEAMPGVVVVGCLAEVDPDGGGCWVRTVRPGLELYGERTSADLPEPQVMILRGGR